MSVPQFVIENNLLAIVIGTIVGFGITQWVTEFREGIIVPHFIEKQGIDKKFGKVVSSTVELLLLLLLLYVIFVYVILPTVKSAENEKQQQTQDDQEWKDNMLTAVNLISKNNEEMNQSLKNIESNIEKK